MDDETARVMHAWLAEQELFERRIRRMRRISLAYIGPYLAAVVIGAWSAAKVMNDYSRWLGVAMLGSFFVILFAQLTQPYMTRRATEKISISTPAPPTDGSVTEVNEASE